MLPSEFDSWPIPWRCPIAFTEPTYVEPFGYCLVTRVLTVGLTIELSVDFWIVLIGRRNALLPGIGVVSVVVVVAGA